MKRKWALLLAVFFLLVSLAAERVSAFYADHLSERRAQLTKELGMCQARTVRTAEEQAECAALEVQAGRISERVRWEKDSTNLLRWFADTAAEVRAHLINSRMMPPEQSKTLTGGGDFERMRFRLRLDGAYGPLVRYVERVERSPHVMVVEKMELVAVRNGSGSGELQMTVSCLSPTVRPGGEGGER